jgi:hypothetical protein
LKTNKLPANRYDAYEIEHERYLEVLEKLVKSELARKQIEDQFLYLKATVESLLNRQMVVTMTDDQAEKMARAVTMYLVDKINELLAKEKNKPFVN